MVMEVRELQPEKQQVSKLVTPAGMVMEVRELQPEKQPTPKLVTLLGMVMFLQPNIKALVAVFMIALQLFLLGNLVFSDTNIKC